MKLTRCGNFQDTMGKEMNKFASSMKLAQIKVDSKTAWEEARPAVIAAMAEASELHPIEEKDILQVLNRLAASGVMIGDNSPATLVKEAAGMWGNIGKGLNWMGQQMGNAGDLASKTWDRAKGMAGGVADAVKNMPQTLQNMGTQMQQSSAMKQAMQAAQQLQAAHAELQKQFPNHPLLSKNMPLPEFLTLMQSGKLMQAAPAQAAPAAGGAAPAPAGAPAAAGASGAPASAPAASPAPAGQDLSLQPSMAPSTQGGAPVQQGPAARPAGPTTPAQKPLNMQPQRQRNPANAPGARYRK